jgi:predicted nucleic acid-binding protein
VRGYVLDASFALAVLLPDEASPVPEDHLAGIAAAGLHVPALWWVEVGNSLLTAERRSRLSPARRAQVMRAAQGLAPETHPQLAEACWGRPLDLARLHGLTLYDACYLDLALQLDATLLSTDRALRRAASAEGIALLPA